MTEERREPRLHVDARITFKPRRNPRIGRGRETVQAVVAQVVKRAAVSLEVGRARVGDPAVRVIENGRGGAPENAGGRVVRADPEPAFAIFAERENRRVRKARFARDVAEQSSRGIEHDDALRHRADRERVLAQARGGEDRGAPENRVGLGSPASESAVRREMKKALFGESDGQAAAGRMRRDDE